MISFQNPSTRKDDHEQQRGKDKQLNNYQHIRNWTLPSPVGEERKFVCLNAVMGSWKRELHGGTTWLNGISVGYGVRWTWV